MSILDIEVKSSFKYQLIFALSACIHLTFLIVFMINGIYGLMLANVASVSFYVIGALTSKKSSIEKHSFGWIIAVYVEITVHAVLCTIWLGFETCFYLYAMVVLIVASYILYLACSTEKFLKAIFPFSVATILSLAGCFIHLLFAEPIYFSVFNKVLTNNQIALMRGINIFFNVGIILFFSLLFIAEMNVLIKKMNETNERLNYIAKHDALTGLYNRYSIYELIENSSKFIETGKKSSESHPYCIIMGDIDNFKKINDTYGHDCGDDVLRSVANIFKTTVDKDDLICRWGGEEILLILHGEKQACIDEMNSIRIQIGSMRVHSGDYSVKVTMTFGLVYCKELTEEKTAASLAEKLDALVQVADERLYIGKNSGKNKVVFQTEEINS